MPMLFGLHCGNPRTTLPLYEEDREAIKIIREHYGVKTDADAIRITLHELERLIKGVTPSRPRRNGPHLPRAKAQGFTGRNDNDTYSGGIVLRSLARLWQASDDKGILDAVASILKTKRGELVGLFNELLGNKAGEADS